MIWEAVPFRARGRPSVHNCIMSIGDDTELLHCFRPLDRPELVPPDSAFPIQVDPCFAWSAGPRTFLLYRDRSDARPKGIVFHRSTSAVPDMSAMCEWCHRVRSHGGVKLLTASLDARKSVGLYLCSDLGCVKKAREAPGPDDFDEGLDADARIQKIVARISTFASRRLF